MTSRERILAALRRSVPDRVPTFEWFIDPGVGLALTGSADPLEIVDALDIDAVNVRPDYARERVGEREFRDEWGCVRRETGDVLPAVVGSPVADLEAAVAYRFPDPGASHRFLSLERAISRFDKARAVVLNLRDGFSDLRDLMGYESALVALVTEPGAARDFLERIVDQNLALARVARERYGVEIVATTDDVAYPGGLLVRPEVYHATLGPAFRRAIAGFKSLGYLCVKHSDGDVRSLVGFWVECGIDCLDPIDPRAGLDLGAMRREWGGRICLKGNVDCAGVLVDGSADEVRAAARACIGLAGGAGGYILSSSNTIHRGVPPENYRAMLGERCAG